MKKFLVITSLIFLTGLTGYLVYTSNTLDGLDVLTQVVKGPLAKSEQFIGQAVQNITQKQDLLPTPLRIPTRSVPASTSALTVSGVIKWTNVQRANNGEAALAENSKLDQAAAKKVQDMFAKQYFEHISPSGVGPSDLANSVGYKYVLIGENLALGDFKDSQTLVEDWMNSPGHRANILNNRYQEIGVAVARGQYQGETVWLAVQEFGAPLSACPQVDQQLQTQIAANNAQLKTMQQNLDAEKAQLDAQSGRTDEAYRQAVQQYNQHVAEYNSLIEATKLLVSQYNAQVNAFNACVNS